MEPKGTFGPRLRQERERRQISLASIAANTKINQSLLAALERDDVTRWPSGIFRRAFLRSYATAIGLNPDDVWKEFSERFPDPNPPVDAAGEAQGRTDVSAERHAGTAHTVAQPQPERAPASPSGSSVRLEHARSDRVELVFRVSVPRSWVNLALRAKALASRGVAWPRSQNQNT